jgi:hypothetical protein
MRWFSRSATRSLTALVAAAALATLPALPAAAHDSDRDRLREMSQLFGGGVNVPFAASDNVQLVDSVPKPGAISGVFSPSAPYFYVSSLESIDVYDVSDPLHPALTGTLPEFVFENEAMNYGERTLPRGKVIRFVLVGVDLTQASPGSINHSNPNGANEVVLVDVTDPANPYIRSRTPATTFTHTVACVQVRKCTTAYTAGDDGEFSIIDLTNLDRLREVDAQPAKAGLQPFRSPAAGPGGPLVSGHKWNFDNAGYGFHTGGAGTAVFDVTRPRSPRLVTTTGAAGVAPGWNDFIHHNSDHPNAKAFTPHSSPSVSHGNVVLITEEDYENTDCATAGSFQTWKINSLDGAASAVKPLDKINPVTEGGGGISPPQYAFCSAHWFDYHPSGIVALATYGGGLRLIDVRDPRNLKQVGYATWGASEVWDAYWAPRRNAAGQQIGSSNIVYTVDLVRGLDVYSVDLPGQAGAKAAVPLGGSSFNPKLDGGAALVLVAGLGSVMFLRRRLGHSGETPTAAV